MIKVVPIVMTLMGGAEFDVVRGFYPFPFAGKLLKNAMVDTE
jgi:hypothetical protein